jgi:hypothetical protein
MKKMSQEFIERLVAISGLFLGLGISMSLMGFGKMLIANLSEPIYSLALAGIGFGVFLVIILILICFGLLLKVFTLKQLKRNLIRG